MNQNIDESIFQSVDISTFQEIINDINDHYENENNLSRVDHSIDNSPMNHMMMISDDTTTDSTSSFSSMDHTNDWSDVHLYDFELCEFLDDVF